VHGEFKEDKVFQEAGWLAFATYLQSRSMRAIVKDGLRPR